MSLLSTNLKETNRYILEIAVSPEDFEVAVAKAYKKEGKQIQIQGFRKGKAPRALIEKVYGEKVFYDAAIDELYSPTVQAAIEESGLKVVAVGEVDSLDAEKETGLNFKINVVVKPEVNIEGYKGIEIEKESTEVTDEEVDAEIKKVQDRNSRMISVDNRTALTGDTAVIDYEGFLDGVPFEGGKGEGHELALGAGQFIPGFEDQVVGHSVGEEFDINVTFPEEYHSEDLKGKEVVFKIKLHEIKMKELPELDDEFVKDVSEFDTLDEYKADIRAKMEEDKVKKADAAVDSKLIETVVEKLEADIPNEMIEEEINQNINSFAYRLQSQGLNLQTYMQYTNMTPETIREQFRTQSDNNVKARLALEKIVELEKIEPSDEDIDAEYAKLAETYGMPLENVQNMIAKENLTLDIAIQKAVDLVKAEAVIK